MKVNREKDEVPPQYKYQASTGTPIGSIFIINQTEL